jgi:hypothetical protein
VSLAGCFRFLPILDANRYVDLCRGLAEVIEQTSRAERIYLPLIVLGELHAGFLDLDPRCSFHKHIPQLSLI